MCSRIECEGKKKYPDYFYLTFVTYFVVKIPFIIFVDLCLLFCGTVVVFCGETPPKWPKLVNS